MEKTKLKSKGKMTVLLSALIVFGAFTSNSYAKEKKHGAELVIQKKDGQSVRGELLTVKDNSLLVMESGSLSGGNKTHSKKIEFKIPISCRVASKFQKDKFYRAKIDYKYIPVKVEAFQLTGYYAVGYDQEFNTIYSSMIIDFSGERVNFGGFGIGINFGFHF